MNLGIFPDSETNRRILRLFSRFLILLSVEFLFAVFIVLQSKSEEHSQLLFGYSIRRLAIAGIFIMSAVIAGLAGIKGRNKISPRVSWMFNNQGRSTILMVAFIMGVVAWLGMFIPVDRLGVVSIYVENSSPVINLFFLISIEIIMFWGIFLRKNSISNIRPLYQNYKKPLRSWLIILLTMTLIWLVILHTGLGINSYDEDFWYGAGVPVMAGWILTVVVIVVLISVFEKDIIPLENRAKFDSIVFVTIWVVTAILWISTPAPSGWLNSRPLPPTYQTYPTFDAAKYDIQSQLALIGQGLNNGAPTSRPVYPVFLVLVHVLTGQNYENNMNFQAAVLALFPAIIYILGSQLLDRKTGIASSIIVMLRGKEAIAATGILDLANSKQILTDFPLAVGIAVMLVCCVLWYKYREQLAYPLLAGGFIGFSAYLRSTVLIIVPLLLILAYFSYGDYMKKWIIAGGISLIIGYLFVSMPWEVRNYVNTGKPIFPSGVRKAISTVYDRYPHESGNKKTKESTEVSIPSASDWRRNDNDQSESLANYEILQSVKLNPFVFENHFFHNIITSTLIFPTSFILDDLKTMVRADNSYWKFNWNGELTYQQNILIFVNLACLALGVLLTIRKRLIAGLMPMGVFIFYHFGNSLARTSGGRYIVPVDWILILYYSAGLVYIIQGVLRSMELVGPSMPKSHDDLDVHQTLPQAFKRILIPATGLLIVGLLIIVPDFAFRKQYERIRDEQLMEIVSQNLNVQESGITKEYISRFLARRGHIYSGRILYPRYADHPVEGVLFLESYLQEPEYPLTTFALVGGYGFQAARFTGPVPTGLPNYADAFVIGCQQNTIFETIAILIIGDQPKMFVREPLPSPKCPLR